MLIDLSSWQSQHVIDPAWDAFSLCCYLHVENACCMPFPTVIRRPQRNLYFPCIYWRQLLLRETFLAQFVVWRFRVAEGTCRFVQRDSFSLFAFKLCNALPFFLSSLNSLYTYASNTLMWHQRYLATINDNQRRSYCYFCGRCTTLQGLVTCTASVADTFSFCASSRH